MRKYAEKKTIKISSPHYETELWKAIEVNNEPKLNVDEQQDDIKHLKEQCDIDNEDEVQEITAARKPMKKTKAEYVPWYQTFAMKNELTNHIQEQHTELWWNYSGKIFRNRKEVDNHMYGACK